jgi:hypothetical protein
MKREISRDEQLHRSAQTLATLRAAVVSAAPAALSAPAGPDGAMARQELAALTIAAQRAKREFDALARTVLPPGKEPGNVWVDVDVSDL